MKTVQIKGTKVNVFEEKELKEKLRLNDEETSLVLTYQRKFPELLKDEEGFCIDGKILWNELGKPQGDFSNWIVRKVLNKKYIENKDYDLNHKTVEQVSGAKHTKEYTFTLICAKKIAMRENTNSGDLVCEYFITMEKALKSYEKWAFSRGLEKDGWNEMSECVKQWCERKGYDCQDRIFYIREANLLNESLLGYPAQELNYLLKNNDKITRNHLDIKINNGLQNLQTINCSLLMADMSFEERKNIIETTCKNKYSHLKEEFNEFVLGINKAV